MSILNNAVTRYFQETYITAGAWKVTFNDKETCLTTSGAMCAAMRLSVTEEHLFRSKVNETKRLSYTTYKSIRKEVHPPCIAPK